MMDRREFMQRIAAVVGLGSGNPPYVIRGLNSQNPQKGAKKGHQRENDCVGLHWLRGTVPFAEEQPLVVYLGMFFGDGFEEADWGLWKYNKSFVWPNRVSLNTHTSAERAERITAGGITLEIPGSAIEGMTPDLFFAFMRGLDRYAFDCRRVDVFYDDCDRLVTPRDLYPMVYEVDLLGHEFRREFTGFLTCKSEQEVGGRRAKELGGGRGLTYDCVRFGRRGSAGCGKSMRVYDKNLESKGERDCVRWELELCQERSRKCWQALMHTSIEDTPKLLGMVVGGSIDFRHRPVNGCGELLKAGDKNWKRLERFDFWQTIIGKLGELPLANPLPSKRVEKAAAWLDSAVGGTLQMLGVAWGADQLVAHVMDIVGSRDRLRTSHLAALAEYDSRMKREPVPTIKAVRGWADRHGVQLESEPGELEPLKPTPLLPQVEPVTSPTSYGVRKRRLKFVLGLGKQHLWQK